MLIGNWNNGPAICYEMPSDLGGGAPNPTPEPAPAPTPGPEPGPEQFTSIDPNTLAPELQPFYKNMQGDYTRKMQEIATIRKTAEQIGVTPEQLPDYVNQVNQVTQFQTQARRIYQTQGPEAAQRFISESLGIQPNVQPQYQQPNQIPQQNSLADEVLRELAAEDPDSAEMYAPVVNKLANAMQQKIDALQKQVAPAQQFVSRYEADQKLQAATQEVSRIAGQLGKMIDDGKGGKIVDPKFEDAVFGYAAEHGIMDPSMLETAAIQMLGGYQALQQIAIQNYVKELQTKQPQGTTLTVPGAQAVVVQDYRSMKPEDMWEKAKADVYQNYQANNQT